MSNGVWQMMQVHQLAIKKIPYQTRLADLWLSYWLNFNVNEDLTEVIYSAVQINSYIPIPRIWIHHGNQSWNTSQEHCNRRKLALLTKQTLASTKKQRKATHVPSLLHTQLLTSRKQRSVIMNTAKMRDWNEATVIHCLVMHLRSIIYFLST